MNINGTEILALVGAGLALFFDYFPFVAAWFDGLAKENKQLLTLLLATLVGVGAFGGSCLGWFTTNLVCTLPNALALGYDIVVTVATMYGFHAATKPSAGLKARMFGRK